MFRFMIFALYLSVCWRFEISYALKSLPGCSDQMSSLRVKCCSCSWNRVKQTNIGTVVVVFNFIREGELSRV